MRPADLLRPSQTCRLACGLALLACAAGPAAASQTLCTFWAGTPPDYHELEFIGYGDAAPLVVYSGSAWRGGQRAPLSPPHLVLQRFKPRTGAVVLEFRNPGDPDLPPTLALRGVGGHARLSVDGKFVEGNLACD